MNTTDTDKCGIGQTVGRLVDDLCEAKERVLELEAAGRTLIDYIDTLFSRREPSLDQKMQAIHAMEVVYPKLKSAIRTTLDKLRPSS